jgi:hypothetical protein
VPQKATVPTEFTYGEIEELFFEFEKLLRKQSASVPHNSNLERAGLTAMQMLATYKKEIPHDYKKDFRNEWRRVLSMADVLRKIISLQNYPAFNSIWPHVLLLLGNGEIAQNLWSPKEDGHANKVFELYAGLLALPLCTNIDMDHPQTSSGGKNPDIIATAQNTAWGIACKVMHSGLAKSMLDRVREGIEQIDRCSNVQRGLVVVSLKNVISHDDLWPVLKETETEELIYLSASSDKIAVQKMKALCKRYEIELLELLGGKDGFRALFQGTKVEPWVLAYLSTATSLLRNGKPTFTLIRMLVAINVDDPLPESARRFAVAMNEILHDNYLDPKTMEANLTRFA